MTVGHLVIGCCLACQSYSVALVLAKIPSKSGRIIELAAPGYPILRYNTLIIIYKFHSNIWNDLKRIQGQMGWNIAKEKSSDMFFQYIVSNQIIVKMKLCCTKRWYNYFPVREWLPIPHIYRTSARIFVSASLLPQHAQLIVLNCNRKLHDSSDQGASVSSFNAAFWHDILPSVPEPDQRTNR